VYIKYYDIGIGAAATITTTTSFHQAKSADFLLQTRLKQNCLEVRHPSCHA